MNIYFKDIRVIDPAQNIDETTNLWIKDGVIVSYSSSEAKIDSDTETVDGKNLVCSPGLFDMHVHLREPGYEYKEDVASGCLSAANGGFTGICCMPNTNPVIDNPSVLEFIKQKANGNLVDVEVSSAITVKSEGKYLAPMFEMNEHGAVLFTDDGRSVSKSEVMKNAFDYAGTRDLLIAQHCEDHSMTSDFSANEGVVSAKLGLKGYPSVAEEITVSRDIMLAEYCGNVRYHVAHLSTRGALRMVRDAKARGMRVTCEVTPHHFSISEEEVHSFSPNVKMNPPLRTDDDIQAILDGIKEGTVDCIATDHAPHALQEKDVEYEKAPCGIIGLETSLGLSISKLVKSGLIDLKRMIEIMSVNPRKLLKLPEIKISQNEKANLTIFDPDAEWSVDIEKFKSKSTNSPFNGIRMIGKPRYTINNNQLHTCNL
jgi:dihydroorotase